MTKARDLANASTALSAVSATELAFVDGVTSAIQTQMDGKQAINANVSTTELGYLDGVTSAVQTQLDAKIAKTLTTTTGDIIYASAANTPARLGIGSSAQVLTVASGIPSWATASAGGLTSLSSGSLYGGATFLISSIPSGYKDLLLVINRNAPNTDGDTLRLRINENTASNYAYFSTMTSTNTSFGSTFFEIAPAQDNSANAGTTIVYLPEYLTATGAWKQMISNSIANNPTTATNFNWATTNGVYKVSSAVTSLTIYNSSSDFADGNYVLYGVK